MPIIRLIADQGPGGHVKIMLPGRCEPRRRTIIEVDGATIRTKIGLRDHPLLKHELAARGFITKLLHRLCLDVEPIGRIGRPTSGIGWKGDDGDE